MAQQAGEVGNESEGRDPALENADVELLLARLARALTSGDGATVAALWEAPALVVGDRQAIAVGSRDEVAQFFSGAKQQYNAQGIVDTRPDIMRLEWATERIAIVKVRWPYIDASGRERGDERSTYTLRRDDNGELKVRAVVMHGVTRPH